MSSVATATAIEPSGFHDATTDAAFLTSVDAWQRELESNWSGGYAQMPNAVRNDPSLSAKAKLVYEQLLSHMWFKTDRCWPSQATLAEATGYSRRTVIRAVQELYERGYIESWRRGLGSTNYYFINPLSFARSFRPIPGPRTAMHLPHSNVLPIRDPAFLGNLSGATARPVEPVYPEVTDCHTESDRLSQQQVTDCHTNYTKTKVNVIQENEISISSGTAASLEMRKGVADKTIGNAKTKNPTKTNDENEQQSNSNSKPSSTSSEMGGAERAKASLPEKSDVKASKWEAIVLASGVPLDAMNALETFMQHCTHPDRVPLLVEGLIDQASQQFGNISALTGNRTQAAKLYQYARMRGMESDVLEDAFREWVRTASHVPPFVQKKMAWFFKALKLELLKALLTHTMVAADVAVSSDLSATSVKEDYDHEAELPLSTISEQEEAVQEHVSLPINAQPECKEQQAIEPEYLLTDDPAAGWATSASAGHWADRLREHVGKDYYRYEVRPTRFGRWGFLLFERNNRERLWEYTSTDAVKIDLKEEEQ